MASIFETLMTPTSSDVEAAGSEYSLRDSEYSSSLISENETWIMSSSVVNEISNFGNSSGSQNPSDQENILWTRIVILLLYGIICIVGLCGNTLVIYTVVRSSKMKTVINLHIVNLAIADEIFLIGIPLLMATTYLESWPIGEMMCKIYFTTTSVSQITSSMFLLIMSADRFIAICYPFIAIKWLTPFVASVVAISAWCLSAAIMTPIFIYAATFSFDEKTNCNIFWPAEGILGEITFIMYTFILGFAIPLTLTAVFYIMIIVRLWRQGLKGDEHAVSNSKEKENRHRKVTKLVLTVITVYFFCWTPYWIIQLTLILIKPEELSSTWLVIFLLAGCLSYSNSALNPILYAFLSDNFKNSFKKACFYTKRSDGSSALNVDNLRFPRCPPDVHVTVI